MQPKTAKPPASSVGSFTGSPSDEPDYYVDQQTFDRLTAQEIPPSGMRVFFRPDDGRAVFSDADPLYPSASVGVSKDVTPNAVHRRVWVSSQERFVFEYVGVV